jgi:hypothetical protein
MDNKKLKVVFYREDAPIFDGYEHNFFEYAVWRALPELLGDATRVDVDCRFYDVGLTDGFYFDPIPGDFDIAYSDKCVPTRKPAKLYFSVQSDWRNEETRITGWMERAKPDLLLNMYSPAQTLIDACKKCGVRYEYAPWFVVDMPPENYDRPIVAMDTGAMGSHYLWRLKIAEKLRSLKRSDIIVSEKLGLTYNQYLAKLSQTKYYCSGGSDDDIPEIASIPHKFIEVCNYGCCLVSPHMPFMERAGFIDGETYIKLNHVDELPTILASDRWKKIGRAGQVMVQQRHTVEARAELIKQIYMETHHAD